MNAISSVTSTASVTLSVTVILNASVTFFSLERWTDCETANDITSWEIWNETGNGVDGEIGTETANGGEIWT